MIAFKERLTPVVAGFFLLLLAACHGRSPMLKRVDPNESGIHFNNKIVENDSINPLDMTNIYNGGGVGIGDFNGDGLPDIYFTGNLVPNKLYLNKGNFKFEDITDVAGVAGKGEWFRGVSVVDINSDGLPDIYLCANMKRDPQQRTNLLYVNQGKDAQGVPHFKEMAAEYGLADTLYSSMASFFDYDNDGDLDMYLAVNEIPKGYNPNNWRTRITDGSFPSTGHLYRNDRNDSLGHPVFHDVSKQAGVTIEGLGHAATVADINGDGWKDIYVTNDFIGNDILYINNHDGTFTDKAMSYFKHTSANGMGQDIQDINNDGLPDVVELDMNPPDNYRKKMFLNSASYLLYQNTENYGYQYQYVRNSLQLNQGPRVNGLDSIGDPVFSEVSWFAGMAETDWSWTPLVADFNNDGNRDIIVTGGYPKDITDHDFVMFINRSTNLATKDWILRQIPQVRIQSFAFRNNGDLTFTNVSQDWGLTTKGFANGAVYADLDGDGDLDVVINNINDEAQVYRNMTREKEPDAAHYLDVKLVGDSLNRKGFGAMVEVYYDHGKRQVYENNPYRGYLSTVVDYAHFGLGRVGVVDSVVVRWPNGKGQVVRSVTADQVVAVDVKGAAASTGGSVTAEGVGAGTGGAAAAGSGVAAGSATAAGPSAGGVLAAGSAPAGTTAARFASNALFRNIGDSLGVHYRHEERDYIDFNVQRLLPHKFSEYGPSLAVGDIDGNGLDDLIVGGSSGHSAEVMLQQAGGKFVTSALLSDTAAARKLCDDEGVLLFDANGDGHVDLYIAAGGYEQPTNSPAYRDQLYLNDGKGHFVLQAGALPENFTSKFCVRAADFNHDGKPDLFISGRVDPGHYPQPVSSFIYRNDSKDGQVRFTDVTASVAPGLQKIGMVCDGLWTDVDNDGWPDLLLAGEFMPLTIFKNDGGVFKDVTAGTGVGDEKGWWNSIVAGDFDNDGDIDYVVGNLGLNSFYRGSKDYPVRVYGKDFDKNGVYDLIPSLYLPDSNGEKREYPAMGRDDLLRQMTSMRQRFPTYKSFATATMDEVLKPDQRQGAVILEANQFHSCLFRNDGRGKFTMVPLPMQAQLSVLNGMVAGDFDHDGNLDLIINGNDYGTEVTTGRYDALNGLFLKGDGKGGFNAGTILQSGIYIPGDGKALAALRGAGGRLLLAAGQNRGPLLMFAERASGRLVPLEAGDVTAEVKLKNGKTRREEFHYGESFLSQSGRFIEWSDPVVSIEITDQKGQKRIIK